MFSPVSDILSQSQLKKLSDHKYTSSSASFCDPYMNHFWNWLVEKFPQWLAPNLITLIGLFINVVTSLILVYFSPDARQDCPRWSYFCCALGLFVYQSLDACDGKHARRTNTSSPLGELFDHGCDAISTVFVSIGTCIALQMGELSGWLFFECFAGMALFYCAHWQTYVSGSLKFGKFDVTEAQFCVIIIHLMTAFLGPAFWNNKIPILAIKFKMVPILISILAAMMACYMNFTVIFSGGSGKNGSTVAGTSVLFPILPLAAVIVPAFVIYQKSTTNIFETHPCLYILAFGMVSVRVTNRLVIAHMSKSEMDLLDSSMIGPGMLFLNQYFSTILSEYLVLWLCLIYSALNLLFYCSSVCLQICRHLNLSCFRITPQISVTPQPSLVTRNSKNGSKVQSKE